MKNQGGRPNEFMDMWNIDRPKKFSFVPKKINDDNNERKRKTNSSMQL